jgi:hypothetical protein
MSARLQGRPVRVVVCLRTAMAQRAMACWSALGFLESQTAPARAGVRGPSGSVPGRRAEGACRVTSIARGRANLVRPHRYAASPTRS